MSGEKRDEPWLFRTYSGHSSAKASNAPAVAATGADFSLVPQGLTVFGTLSYRLWGPDESPKPAMLHK